MAGASAQLGLRVYTAVNTELQRAAEAAVHDGLRDLDHRQGFPRGRSITSSPRRSTPSSHARRASRPPSPNPSSAPVVLDSRADRTRRAPPRGERGHSSARGPVVGARRRSARSVFRAGGRDRGQGHRQGRPTAGARLRARPGAAGAVGAGRHRAVHRRGEGDGSAATTSAAASSTARCRRTGSRASSFKGRWSTRRPSTTGTPRRRSSSTRRSHSTPGANQAGVDCRTTTRTSTHGPTPVAGSAGTVAQHRDGAARGRPWASTTCATISRASTSAPRCRAISRLAPRQRRGDAARHGARLRRVSPRSASASIPSSSPRSPTAKATRSSFGHTPTALRNA